jgi:FkbM family methyltransferase
MSDKLRSLPRQGGNETFIAKRTRWQLFHDGSIVLIFAMRLRATASFFIARLQQILQELQKRVSADERPAVEEPILDHALRRLRGHQIPINSLIDVGASNGIWSKKFARYFPDRHHLLLEANQIHAEALDRVCRANSNWVYRMSAVGPTNGTLFFDGSDPLGGHVSAIAHTPNYKPFPVNTLDRLLEENPLPTPYMIKLDVHGVEIPILNAAVETLKQTNALVIEAYNFKFGDPAIPFWDLCQHLVTLGYRPLDVFDVLYREVDRALWQFDLLFVKSDLALFRDLRYFVDGRH